MRASHTAKDRALFKAEIVSVARKQFIEKGYDATSMEDIAVILRVSKPTVYEAFPSKQALFEAVVENAISDFDSSWVQAAIIAGDSFADFIDRTANQAIAIASCAKRSGLLHLLMREGLRARDMVVARVKKPADALFDDMISAAIERGECRKIDPTLARELLVAPFSFVAFQQVVLGERYDRAATEAYLKESYAMLKAALLLTTKGADLQEETTGRGVRAA